MIEFLASFRSVRVGFSASTLAKRCMCAEVRPFLERLWEEGWGGEEVASNNHSRILQG